MDNAAQAMWEIVCRFTAAPNRAGIKFRNSPMEDLVAVVQSMEEDGAKLLFGACAALPAYRLY